MGHLRCLTRCLWAENKVTGTEHSAECWAQSTPEPWGSELWPPAYPRAAWRVYGQVIRRDQGLQSCLNTFYGQCHKKATRTHKKSKESISANFSKPCQMRSKSFGVLALLSQWETDILYFPLKLKLIETLTFFGLPWWLKRIHRYVGDAGLIPGSGGSPGENNGYLLHDSCLGNPMDRGQATVHKVTKSQTRLSD